MSQIQKKILEFLKRQDWPTTTEDIAKAVNISWQTAQMQLLKLYADGKILFRKVGRQNQWWLKKSYEKNM